MMCEENQSSSWPLSIAQTPAPRTSTPANRTRSDRGLNAATHFAPLSPASPIHGGSSTILDVREQRQQTHRNIIQEEDPAPVEVVRDVYVAAQRVGPIAGAHTTASPYIAKQPCPRLFGGNVSAQESALLAWRQPTTADTLQHAEEDPTAEASAPFRTSSS